MNDTAKLAALLLIADRIQYVGWTQDPLRRPGSTFDALTLESATEAAKTLLKLTGMT